MVGAAKRAPMHVHVRRGMTHPGRGLMVSQRMKGASGRGPGAASGSAFAASAPPPSLGGLLSSIIISAAILCHPVRDPNSDIPAPAQGTQGKAQSGHDRCGGQRPAAGGGALSCERRP